MGAFSEAVGGLLLMLGLQTQLAAFFNICTLLVAAFWQQSGQGLWNILPAIGFIWACLPALALGSGRFGLDYLLTGPHGWRWQRPAPVVLLLSRPPGAYPISMCSPVAGSWLGAKMLS